MDELRKRYEDLLTGSYDCVDRIVLNAYFSMATTRVDSGSGGASCTGVATSTSMTRT
jgi:hypothetical protein